MRAAEFACELNDVEGVRSVKATRYDDSMMKKEETAVLMTQIGSVTTEATMTHHQHITLTQRQLV